MLQDYKDKTLCVVDGGIFLSMAVHLAKYFKKVYYYTEWRVTYPKTNDIMIGEDIPEIERINFLFDKIDEIDLFFFPYIYNSDLQLHLESLGKRVFGSRRGDELELYRVEMKELMKKLELPVNDYKVIKGIDNLRKYLKANDNKYIKVSFTRGDFESFKSPSYKLIEPVLDDLAVELGVSKNTKEFIVEEPVNAVSEIGYDGYCIDGKYPSKGYNGIEIKECGFITILKDYKDLPKEITEFNEKIAPTFENYGYKNFFSTEIRVTDKKKAYMIDFTARLPSPPSELYQLLYANLPDIIWYGAEGELIEPETTAKFGVQVTMNCLFADKNPTPIYFPKKYKDNIKLRDYTIIDGITYIIPRKVEQHNIGWVCAVGNTLQEAIDEVKKIGDNIEAYDLKIPYEALDKAQKQIKDLEDNGIKMI